MGTGTAIGLGQALLSGTGEDPASLACIVSDASDDPEEADEDDEAPGLTDACCEARPLSGFESTPDTAAATAAMPALDSTEDSAGFMPGGGGAPLAGTPAAPNVLEYVSSRAALLGWPAAEP